MNNITKPLKIKNWNKFQHFKDRSPPWIKLHRDILEQRDINMISDCSFRVLVGLWLLASEDKEKSGALPSVDDMSFRLRIEKPKIIKALSELSPWIEQPDIKVISRRYQDDTPETEEETETETEGEIDIYASFDEWYSLYPRKKEPKKARASYESVLKKKLSTPDDLVEGLRKYCEDIKKNGTETKYIKHPATWLNQGCYDDDYSEIIHPRTNNEGHRGMASIALELAADMERNG